MDMVSDVIVVGAGLSGLTAAKTLSQRGLKVIVLEATDRLGGRMCTLYPERDEFQYGWAELGATFLTPEDVQILRMCEEYGLKTLDVDVRRSSIHEGRARRLQDWRTWRRPLVAWDLTVMLRRLDKMCSEVPLDNPWDAPQAEEWDQLTLKDFCDKHCWTKCCQDYLMMMARVQTSSEGKYLSLLYYLWELCIAGGPYHSLGVIDYTNFKVIEGGSQQLIKKIAADLGNPVVLNQPVTMIQYGDNEIKVKTLHGQYFRAKYLVLATPLLTQMKIHFEPALPALRTSLIQRSPLGVVMKCAVFYKTPFWKARGLHGLLTCMDARSVVWEVHLDATERGALFGLNCFIYQQHVARLSLMTDEEKLSTVTRTLANILKSDEALTPAKFLSKDWSAAPYECGGYNGYYAPGVLTSYGEAMRAPIGGRIFLAGSEAATESRGSLSGALLAGEQAAKEVLQADGLIEEKEITAVVVESASKCHEMFVPSIEFVVKAAKLALGAAMVIYYAFLE